MKKDTAVQQIAAVTRAVLRRIVAGSQVYCTGCEQIVKFSAKTKANQVIANIYVSGRWDRVEHWHEACYDAADQPHGIPDDSAVLKYG